MKLSLLGSSLAVLSLIVSCSQEKPTLAPVEPDDAQNTAVPQSIAFLCDEAELSENGSAAVTLRVTPADAQVVPTSFRLADAET